jgi:hypothetical protein
VQPLIIYGIAAPPDAAIEGMFLQRGAFHCDSDVPLLHRHDRPARVGAHYRGDNLHVVGKTNDPRPFLAVRCQFRCQPATQMSGTPDRPARPEMCMILAMPPVRPPKSPRSSFAGHQRAGLPRWDRTTTTSSARMEKSSVGS